MKNRKIFVASEPPAEPSTPLVNKAIRLSEAGQFEDALRLLATGTSAAPEIRNARGVCLLRLGRAEDAVRTFRALVVPSGCTWMNKELPVHYRTNFSTALLLAGLPLGAKETLHEIPEKYHPSVLRLQAALASWVRGLSWWQRLNWKMGLAPDVPVRLDFLPGEFADPLSTGVATPSAGVAASTSVSTTNQVA
ncbi:MAG: tetratricopeptide repeat protein [Fuerstiella sp.]